MELNGHAIRRVRLPAHLGGRAGVRATLERWLAARDLRRYRLPPDAIVLVRGLRANWAQVAGPAEPLRDDALAAVLSGALRPAVESGAMPATSAVWFTDESELLACMARDSLAGRLSAQWWWATLLRGGADRDAAMRYWSDSARAAPRAAGRLQAIGKAAAWFESCNSSARRAMLVGLARHFPVSAAVQHFVDAGSPEGNAAQRSVPAGPDWRNDSQPGKVEEIDAAAGGSAAASAPARLQRLCLDLGRDPACAIDRRYVERALRREQLASAQEDSRSGSAASSRPGAPGLAKPEPSAGRLATLQAQASVHAPGSGALVVRDRLDAPTPQTIPSPDRIEANAIRDRPDDIARHIPASELPDTARQVIRRAGAEPSAAFSQAAFDNTSAFNTQYGGLFFVINAALQLGLYGDFSQPLQRGIEMSPWQFLCEVGRAFGSRRFSRDPLAAWLKPRSHRVAESAACDTDAPWRIERDWLRAFEGEARPLRAVFESGRLSLRHPTGFAICDIPATAAQSERLIAEQLAALGLSSCAVVRVAVSQRVPRAAPEPPARFALPSQLLPYLRARLALALGLRDARRLAGVLLRMPARVQAGADRIDVFIALQRLPLAVRLAGLDRDPGWVPAAGRDLRFHFE